MLRGLLERAVRDVAWSEWGRGVDVGVAAPGNTAAGVTVSQRSAMHLSTIYACVTLRGETVMAMPVDQITSQGGVSRETASRAPWLDQPNPEVGWPNFVDQVMWSLDVDGNAFVMPVRGGPFAEVRELWLLDPAEVQVRRDDPSKPRSYWVQGREVTGEVVHMALHIPPGRLRGVNPIDQCAEAIGLGVAVQQYGGSWFGNSAMPSVVIEVPGAPTVDQQREMRSSWFRHHGGPTRANLPGVLVGGATAKVLNLSPEQSQFLDTRRFSVLELCALWKVPPEMLGVGAEGSGAVLYQNLERVKLRFVQQALLAPLMLIESTFSKFLPRSQRIRFNTDAYLRADTTVRYNAHAVALGAGFMTVDEVRQLEDLPPMPEQPTPEPSMPDAGSDSESEEGDDDATD